MDDLISRQAAVNEKNVVHMELFGRDFPVVSVATLKGLPPVDAVPVKHGRWIYHPDWQADGECGYECSECGMGSDVDYPYCMLCGARMERKGR